MSQQNSKYKRLEALLSEARPARPDPVQPTTEHEVDKLKAQVAELEAKVAGQQPAEDRVSMRPASDSVSSSMPVQPINRRSAILKADPPGGTGLKARNAFWLLPTLLMVYVTTSVVYVIALAQTGAWQMKIALATTLLLVVIASIALWLNRLGRGTQGTILDIWAMVLIFPIIPTLYVGGIGLALGFITPIAAFLLASALLTRKQALWAISAGILSGLTSILLDLYWPHNRIDTPLLHLFVSGVFLLGIVVFLLVVIRQFADYSIHTKLIIAFVALAVGSLGIVSFVVQRSFNSNLTENIGTNLSKLANSKASEIGQIVDRESDVLKALALNKDVRQAAASANQTNFLSQAEIAGLDQQWRSADATNNNTDALVVAVLNNSVSNELRLFQKEFSQHVEIFLTDGQGVSIASTNRTSDYYQADEEWWQTAYQEGIFIGQPEYDESSKTIAINMATAVWDNRGAKVTGILRTTVNFTTLFEPLKAGQFGQTGHTDIYLPNGQELTLETLEDGNLELVLEDAGLDIDLLTQSTEPYMEVSHEGVPTLASQVLVTVPSDTDADAQQITKLNWHVVVLQDQTEALEPVNAQTRNILLLTIALSIVAAFTAVGFAQYISGPIIRLNAMAERVSTGDLSVQAKVETGDETGALATTLNNMTSQLRSLFGSLEQRVQDRTHDLELAVEVGRTTTEKISNVYAMLSQATEMIRSRFDLYYTQVYLLDPGGRTLILRAGTGDVGRQLLQRGHHLLINSGSLNGRAVSEMRPIIVADTSTNPNFLPNPLLPKTRSEMVVPLIVGGRVLGVLDMQSEIPDALNQFNLPAFETLAGQLSIAIQNATLFSQSEEARKQVEANVRQTTDTGWHDFLNAIERGEKIGFTYDQADVVPMDNINAVTSTNALNVPITVTGANVGAIQLVEEERRWTADETEIVQATAAQLAQHINNLRLLAQAEGYRSEAEQAVRRLTREGWQEYSSTTHAETAGYVYDLEQVRPLKVNGHRTSEGVTPIPLTVRDEVIGELEVAQGVASEGSMEIIEAVAKQLSAHIENVRLSEQNELRAAELEKLVTQLRELDRLKSSFLANMSHELRTPLNSILGFADVMLEELDGPLTGNMSNDLGLIQKNGQHLLHLINDVLDMAKIESGNMNLNPETFRVHEILEDVTSIASPLASEKKLGLAIEEDSDKEVEIFADRTRLRQVMINIVNNAIKFTEQGKISIHAARHNSHVVIKVTDTGIGIPQHLLETVFQEFTQVDISSTRKSGGTGLGLPISRRLIELHGGRIWAESLGISGEGTILNVELPLEAKIAEPERHEKQIEEKSA